MASISLDQTDNPGGLCLGHIKSTLGVGMSDTLVWNCYKTGYHISGGQKPKNSE